MPALSRAEIGEVIAFLRTLTDGYRDGWYVSAHAAAMNGSMSPSAEMPRVVQCSTAFPASIQASIPPFSGRMRLYPIFLSVCATLTAVASLGHAQ